MNPIVRSILAVIAGIAAGLVVIMLVSGVGMMALGIPEGIDPEDVSSIEAMKDQIPPKFFIPVLLAHALGTWVGAMVTCRIARQAHQSLALVIGGVFLLFGILNAMRIPHPTWFVVVDLFLYLPMGWLGWKTSGSRS